ncbi:hypothetical protein F5X99DRAFT_112756 [Biscogniauxia marginata]|nr:hypothetical protein F5X99DRAFT_112756 [Biscogniauxia marginata]
MPRYISPSPSTLRSRSSSRSSSRSQSSFRRGRSVDSSYQGRRRRSPSISASAAHEAKEKTVVKSSLAFLGAIGAASVLANKYWPKGMLYGEKEEWAKKGERQIKAKRIVDGRESRRHKFEWDTGMTSESRRSTISRQSFSEGGGNYHYSTTSSGRSRGHHRGQRPQIYQNDVSSRRKSCTVDGRDLKYVETQASGPHSVPRRYIVDDYDAVIPHRSSRRYSIIER